MLKNLSEVKYIIPIKIFTLVWAGLWQGFGVELSFLVLWLGWNLLHKRVAHKLDPEHFFHRLHDYFMN